MNDEVFDDWLGHLRSGRWRPCRHRLRDGDDGRSAFGCLVEAAVPYRGGGRWLLDDRLGWCWAVRRMVDGYIDTERRFLTGPAPRQPLWPEWTTLHIDRVHGWVDRFGYDFEKIADLLERHEYRD